MGGDEFCKKWAMHYEITAAISLNLHTYVGSDGSTPGILGPLDEFLC